MAVEEGRWEGPLLLFSAAAAAAAVWLPRAYVNNSRERNNASIIILPLTARLCADRVILLGGGTRVTPNRAVAVVAVGFAAALDRCTSHSLSRAHHIIPSYDSGRLLTG